MQEEIHEVVPLKVVETSAITGIVIAYVAPQSEEEQEDECAQQTDTNLRFPAFRFVYEGEDGKYANNDDVWN